MNSFMNIAASSALLLIVLGLAGGAWRFWSPDLAVIIPAGRFPIVLGLLLAIVVTSYSLLRRNRLPNTKELSHPVVWTAGLVFIFFSDWLSRPWGFFQGPFIRGELLLSAGLCYLILRSRSAILLKTWLILSLGILIWSFVLTSQGELLISDDHTMFLFRLRLLKENFPSIPFWYPLWNAGIDARDFFATGALNAFLLAAPLVYLFPVESIYNIIVVSFLWLLLPAASYLAARTFGGGRTTAAVAAILSVSSGLLWYRWGLKYGTMGFLVSATLFPLCVALSIKFLNDKKPSWRQIALLVVVTTLTFLWSPSMLAISPLGLLALARAPRLIRSPRHLVAVLLLICLNLPWIAMMYKVSNVGNFLNAEGSGAPSAYQIQTLGSQDSALPQEQPAQDQPAQDKRDFRHRAGSLDIKRALRELHTQAISINPLLLVFALPALLTLTGVIRVGFALIIGWLIFLGTFGVSLKPQLELDRMVLIAALLLTFPVARYLTALFTSFKDGQLYRLAGSIAGSFLLLSPLAASAIVLNQSTEIYRFKNGAVDDLVGALSTHTADGSRGVFSGCVLHELSGGHLAPLTFWTGVPLVASSYAHNIWRYKQPIPESFIKRGAAGIAEYLDLMNASVVLAHEPRWLAFFQAHQNDYKRVWHGDKFALYKRLGFTPNYALLGEATNITFTNNSLTLTPKTDRVVLKFTYFPFLTSSHCSLKPYKAVANISLIELSECPLGQAVTIKSVPPLQRFISTFDLNKTQ